MEYVRPSMRTIGLNLCIGVFYCIGCVSVPLVAMALGTWRRFLLATSLPTTVVIGYYFVVSVFFYYFFLYVYRSIFLTSTLPVIAC